MPRIVDYPRASLKAALELAKAVDGLGGTTTVDMAAEKTGKKVSGAFNALVGAAVKYNLLESRSGKLSTTSLYREYKLAYNEDEERHKLRTALLSAPLFSSLYQRFVGRELPVSHLDRLLVRELGVPEDIASRVASYFQEGAQAVGLIGPDSRLLPATDSEEALGAVPLGQTEAADVPVIDLAGSVIPASTAPANEPDTYSVRVTGPGMNSVIEVREDEDLLIVQAMLKKVERALAQKQRPADE